MKNIFMIIAISICIASCQKEIDVDLNETNPIIVLEGNYSSEDSTVVLKVSLTSSYFDSAPSSSIDNLNPTITNEAGVSQSLVSIGDGEYILTNYIPTYNSTYQLDVLYNGQLYSASSTLPQVVDLDIITYEFTPGFFGSDDGYFSYLNFLDPADTTNYYIVQLSLNQLAYDGLTDLTLQDDALTDGNTISRPIFSVPLFQLGDTIGMELRSISEEMFDYYSEIQSIAGSQSSAAPANPKNNWNNDALGYFSAYSKSTQEVIVL